jgi:hypothetical protein
MPRVIKLNDPDFWKNLGGIETELASVASKATGAPFAAFVLSNNKEDPKAPTAMLLYMGPGYDLARHAHSCYRFEVVIQGTLMIGDQVLGPGDVSISGPGEHYGPHIAGPTGCLTCEVFTEQAAVHPSLAEAEWKPQHKEGYEKAKVAVAEFLEKRKDAYAGHVWHAKPPFEL